MPLIRIAHAKQFDQSTTNEIMEAVTTAYASKAKVDPAKVWVIIEEVSPDKWATGGAPLSNARAHSGAR